MALAAVDVELAARSWWRADPELRKALSRAREHLQTILEGVHHATAELQSATRVLVRRGAVAHGMRGRENAWDFAEQLRESSFGFLEDEALRLLLLKEAADTSSISHVTLFATELPPSLLATPVAPEFRSTALALLCRIHKERVDRVRHDRARDKLWQFFVWKLIPVVFALLAGCIALQLLESDPALHAVCAGALGSVLSAVLKLRDGEQRIRYLRRSASFLFLQPMIGATAALVTRWIGVEHVLNDEFLGDTLGPAVGFLSGFSEPFFLGTLGRLSDLGTSSGKGSSEAKGDTGEKGDSDSAGGLRKKGH
jgi:hypothetical protein